MKEFGYVLGGKTEDLSKETSTGLASASFPPYGKSKKANKDAQKGSMATLCQYARAVNQKGKPAEGQSCSLNQTHCLASKKI